MYKTTLCPICGQITNDNRCPNCGSNTAVKPDWKGVL